MKRIGETFAELFLDACKEYSEQIAVICGGIQISYQALYKRSGQIADALSEQGVKENDIVGIMLNRTVDVIAAMTAILRVGAAFLPIDTEFPTERIQYILNDSKCKILIVQKETPFINFAGKVLQADCVKGRDNPVSPEGRSVSGDLAYVIYTSGSTGYPKGVMVSNQAFAAFIRGIRAEIDFHAGKRILAVTTISFDIAMLELLVPLTAGMTVVLADEATVHNSRMLAHFIKKEGINMIQMTPSRMELLLESTRNYDWMLNLSDILIGGEHFPKKLLEQLQSKTGARIYNLYGPTEAAVWVSVCDLTQQEEVTIGIPFTGSRVVICDEKLRPVPKGVTGEICISGEQLASGYIGNPELTKEKFTEGQERVYRTGDIGRLNKTGDLECLGRMDDQVKIRGYRVELNEIAETLLKHEKIKRAVVIAKTGKSGNTYLSAYYQSEEELSVSELRAYLKRFLVSYMIPEEFILIDQFPETLNHKIDKKKLGMLQTGQI